MADDEWVADDLDRLAGIGDLVVAGQDINSFGLGRWEMVFVRGYVKRALGESADKERER